MILLDKVRSAILFRNQLLQYLGFYGIVTSALDAANIDSLKLCPWECENYETAEECYSDNACYYYEYYQVCGFNETCVWDGPFYFIVFSLSVLFLFFCFDMWNLPPTESLTFNSIAALELYKEDQIYKVFTLIKIPLLMCLVGAGLYFISISEAGFSSSGLFSYIVSTSAMIYVFINIFQNSNPTYPGMDVAEYANISLPVSYFRFTSSQLLEQILQIVMLDVRNIKNIEQFQATASGAHIDVKLAKLISPHIHEYRECLSVENKILKWLPLEESDQ